MKYVVFRCRMLKLWFQTVTSDANIQPAVRQGRLFSPWSHNDHVRCSIFMLWLVKIWQVCSYGKFMQPLETCLFWQLLYAFGWSWQSFVPSCDVFNCLFPLDVQNKIQLPSRVFCYSWLVCLLGFWLSLVKVGNPISDASFSFFTLLDA